MHNIKKTFRIVFVQLILRRDAGRDKIFIDNIKLFYAVDAVLCGACEWIYVLWISSMRTAEYGELFYGGHFDFARYFLIYRVSAICKACF